MLGMVTQIRGARADDITGAALMSLLPFAARVRQKDSHPRAPDTRQSRKVRATEAIFYLLANALFLALHKKTTF